MVTDADLVQALTPNVRALPYPGRWLDAPYDKPVAVIARDHHFSEVRVDRRSGAVTVVDLDAEQLSPVAPNLPALVQLADAYATAFAATRGADDDQLELVADQLREELLAIDSTLLDDEDGFWAVAAEDLELGLVGIDEHQAVAIVTPALGPLVFIAVPPVQLQQLLAAEELNLIGYTEHLSFSTWHDPVAEALRGRDGSHGHQSVEVLVTIDDGAVPAATDLASAPALSLHVHLGSEPAPIVITTRPIEQITLPQPGPFLALANLIETRFRSVDTPPE